MLEPVTTVALSSVLKHVLTWLINLRRAGKARKLESLEAINQVILAVRRTNVYSRAREVGMPDINAEAELTVLWTELSFSLQRLGLTKLAKRCDVTGRYWSSPANFSKEWLDQADVRLEAVEKLARQVKVEIQRSP